MDELERGIADLARLLYSAEAKRERERSFRRQMRASVHRKGKESRELSQTASAA